MTDHSPKTGTVQVVVVELPAGDEFSRAIDITCAFVDVRSRTDVR